MVRHQVVEQVEPPQGELGEHPALVGDLGGQHPVVGGHAVAGDHHEVARLVPVEITHFAGVQMYQPRDVRGGGFFDESGHGSSPWYWSISAITPDSPVRRESGRTRVGTGPHVRTLTAPLR